MQIAYILAIFDERPVQQSAAGFIGKGGKDIGHALLYATKRLPVKLAKGFIGPNFDELWMKSACAADAQMGGRVYFEAPIGNGFAAFGAPAIFVFGDPVQGHFYSRPIAGSAPRFGLGHFLLLHRVHPRQAANALLVELDRPPPAGTLLVARLQFGLLFAQLVRKMVNLLAGQSAVHWPVPASKQRAFVPAGASDGATRAGSGHFAVA